MPDHEVAAHPGEASRPDDRPIVAAPDEAALVPAHPLTALRTPGPTDPLGPSLPLTP